MTKHMAESYRQLSEVLGKRVSLPSTLSESTFDALDNDDDDEHKLVDRNDLDEETKRTKMNKLFSRAVSSGDTNRVTQLLHNKKLSKYIDVNAKDEDGATPLIYAACFGKIEIAQALLEAGAKTNVQDSGTGWSALMWATTNKHESIVKILVDHGASAQTRSAKGRTVFDFVNSNNSSGKIAEILAANPRDSLSSAASVAECDFYYQSTLEGYDSFMVEEEERRQKLLETAMALVGDNSWLPDDDDRSNGPVNDYKGNFQYDDDDDDDPMKSLSTEFHWDKCLPDQMFVFAADDLPYILDTMITNIKFPVETQQEICVPANVVFLSARFAHYFSSVELAEQVLEGALERISKVTKENARNIHALAFWMSNQVQLLYYLKKDSGLVVATAEYQLRLSEMISETYTLLIADMEHRLEQVLSKAMLNYEQIGGMEDLDFADDWQRFFRRRNRQPSIAHPDGSAAAAAAATTAAAAARISPHTITRLLSTTFFALQSYEVHPTIIIQVLAQCMHFMSCELFNRILTNKKLLSRSKALQIRMNLSHVEDWVRHQQLPASLLSYLCPTIQLLQLLQCLSQLSDFESFTQTLHKLDQLNAIQIRRCIINYRYEVNEDKVPDHLARYVIQAANDADEDDEAEEDDVSETRDAKFMLPFSVPTTAHMVSIKGWSPNNDGKERQVTPIIPEHWMDKLDKEKYAEKTL
ncbi:hypothetical protein BX666DRAFT_1866827 [Dichotomocladium elegans]|nr:hypothetical protein BX666DRAFT_1866827 [Dichotomocladium elegans]